MGNGISNIRPGKREQMTNLTLWWRVVSEWKFCFANEQSRLRSWFGSWSLQSDIGRLGAAGRPRPPGTGLHRLHTAQLRGCRSHSQWCEWYFWKLFGETVLGNLDLVEIIFMISSITIQWDRFMVCLKLLKLCLIIFAYFRNIKHDDNRINHKCYLTKFIFQM